MRKSLKIRNMELGAGRPKVCVPITGKTQADIISEAELAIAAQADLIEWRADHYEDVLDLDKAAETASKLRKCVGNMPVLFTYRTEGCDNSISEEDYIALNEKMIEEKSVDLIDIELLKGDDLCRNLCGKAHEKGIYVVISNHDFIGTPNDQAIVEMLCKMRELGGDVPKVAVMPNNSEDVLTLLSATNQYANAHADGPLITMSMGWLGGVSRVSGEIFGSALSFGSTVRASAPGQLSAKDLIDVLQVLQKPEEK